MKEFGIQIPDFEMPEEISGIENYLKTVSAAIKDKKDWTLLPEVCIDLFNFRKFVMYKDLDPATWPEEMSPSEHPLIQKIFNPQDPESDVSGFLEEEVDLKLSAKDTFHIMDADSSQIAVIEDVKAGKNLVVEGPPGTGKSQTIANTIAELMAKGKSVLFVSEKMAALQVVKSRLDAAGLGELCLEIHSNQTRKKAVLEELEKTLNRTAPSPINPDRDLNELEKLKKELNEYAFSLEKPAGNLYSSLYTLYGIREKRRAYFEAKGEKMPRYDFQEPETWSPEAWTEAESVLEKMGQVLPTLGPARKNPWYGCEPGLVLPSDLGEIEPLTTECAAAFEVLETAIKILNDLSATSKPHTLGEIATLIDATILLENSKPLPEKMLQNSEWESDSSRADADILVSKLRQYRELKTFADKTFHPSIFDLNTSEFEELSRKFLKIVNPRYRKLKKEISACYISEAPSHDSKILLDLACISECEAHRLELEGAEAKGKKYFLEYWKGFESDPVLLEEYVRWIIPFRKLIKENIFTERSIRLAENGVDRAALESAVNEVTAAKEVFLEALGKAGLRTGADFEKMFGKGLEAVKISQLKSRVNSWKTETSSLVFWSQYLGYRQACLETKAAPMVEDIEAGKIEACDMIPTFEGNYAELLLHRALRGRPALFTFIRELHEGKINKFIELDKKVLLENRKRITCSAYEEAPKLTSGASRASEAGILLNEFNRKRGHMPIRTLMKKAGGLIQKIKPCFLMSPLSIAQYLDPRSTRFDVIIFDEASQVRPEDAVGALLRGKQVVVMGDSKQLPPTDFFDTVVDSPEPELDDYTSAGDMESILNVCKRSFPVKTLRWHYRSRHESLIAISNQEFYDNRLYVYPSPMQKDERLGLKFVHLPDSVYDRGRSGANRVEARAVARAVFEHFSRYPDKSLGVGTFNIKQQEAILEEIEALLKVNPGFDLNSKNERGEHFFVKNLETIQGDERDVILLSVGFGFDSSRKLSLNFGPLNREGGERRLNVLITRAREKCVVFANFTSRDLNLDENSPMGLRSLKVFLEFSESGRLPLPACGKKDFDSPFEEAISDFLTENGCEAHRQIGCAGYRLDLAVPDPVHPGRYVLAIECDGAGYHSSHVARDRDRLREQVLEGLGWKIYRVWSTDWYLRPKESKEKLFEAVKEAVKQAKLQAKSEPEPEIPVINEPSAWADSLNKGSARSLSSSPSDSNSPTNSVLTANLVSPVAGSVLSVAIGESRASMENKVITDRKADTESKGITENKASTESKMNVEDRSNKNFGTPSFEMKSPLETSFESRIENPYSGSSLKLGEGFAVSSDEDFLPEMTLKARSMALLADENSRKKPVRRSGKSKILKFNADPCSEEIDNSKLIPEPEPEKMNFFQAYPEIDFSAGAEKRKKRRRLNEFAYIYGSGGYFESEPDFEEDNYAGAAWNSGSEIVSCPESAAGSVFDPEFEYGTRVLPASESKSEPDHTAGSDLETGYKDKNLQDPLLLTVTEKPEESHTEDNSEFLSDDTAGTTEHSSSTKEKSEKLSVKSEAFEASVPLYRICPLSGLQESGDLSELSDKQLEEAVIKIIEYEGPIHAEALLQRIKSEAGITRMLGKIKQRVFDAVTIAESFGKIRAEGEFYWPVSEPAYILRRRDGDSSSKIEWICDEEIKEAVRFVLNSQYSTPLEDLIVQTSRVLGIKTARKNTKERIEKLVQSGIESNELTLMPNEMIYFAE
jgi:superfamily I DNA and/or RNA helicase/very-short-patch-repair endonuclease